MDRNELTIKPDAFMAMLSDYYCEKLGKDVAVKANPHKESTGIWDEEDIVVDVYLEETIEIRGQNAIRTSYLSREEIEEAVREFIGEDYKLTGFVLQTDFSTVSFDGVKVYMEEKQRKLTKVPKVRKED